MRRLRRRLSPRAALVRRSLLATLMLGFVAALIVVLVTVLLDARLTRGALRQQAKETLEGELTVLSATFTERHSTLITGLRNASQTLAFRDLIADGTRVNVVNELSPVYRNLSLDTIGVVHPDGRVTTVLGVSLLDLPRDAVDDLASGSGHHLVATVDGRYMEIGAVPVGQLTRRSVLIGGYLFDDGTAFRLRLLRGSDIMLVADGGLTGTTQAERPQAPPAFGDRHHPTMINMGGTDTFVDYATVIAATGTWGAEGVVGVALPEPLAQLDRTLLRNRLVAIGVILLVVVLLGVYVERLFARPLLRLASTARRIAEGDTDTSFEARTDDEIGSLAAMLEQMRRSTIAQLEVIRQQARKLRTASERIVDAQDEERRRLANDLHDGLQRQLVLLRTRLGLYRQLREDDPEKAERTLVELEHDAEAAISELRETSRRIFPAILQDQGLTGGLNSLVGRAPVGVELSTDPEPLPRIDPRVEINAYLLASEALTNVVKHADADAVLIHARLRADGLVLDVVDNGAGFEPAAARDDGGLRHLQDRVAAVGGRLDVTSAPGDGTTIQAWFPLRPRDDVDIVSPTTAGGRTARRPRAGSGRSSR